jgi:hypothetical protein
MRIWVRAGARVFSSLGFSRAVGDAPDPAEVQGSTNIATLSPDNPIPGPLCCKGEKITLPGAPAGVSEFIHVAV